MILAKSVAKCLASVGLVLWGFGCPNAGRADEIPQEYRETVRKGLDYLQRVQSKNGYWSVGEQYPVAMTGLAGVALLLEGSTVREGKYADNIRRAADWVMDHSQKQAARDGLIFAETEAGRYMYGHGFSTLFLACAYGDEEDRDRRERLKDILTRAVKYISNAQSSQGGWYYTSAKEGHDQDEGSVTITQLQALRACRNAGIPVPPAVVKKAVEYLRKSTSERGGVMYRIGQPGDRPALTAAAVACSFSAGEYKDELCKRWLKFCQNAIPIGQLGVRFGHDEYTHYYYAQALYNLGDDGWDKLFESKPGEAKLTWSAYRTAMFNQLKGSQNSDGSWSGLGGGFSVGAVYSTSVFLTIMQLDRSCVPFYQRAF